MNVVGMKITFTKKNIPCNSSCDLVGMVSSRDPLRDFL